MVVSARRLAALVAVSSMLLVAACGKDEPEGGAQARPRPSGSGAAAPDGSSGAMGADSQEALVEAALAAIEARDVAAFEGLMFTAELAGAHCQTRLERRRPEVASMAKRYRDALEVQLTERGCAAIDWTTARRVRVSGGEVMRDARECTGVVEHRDVKVHFGLRGGGGVVVRLGDPLLVEADGVWVFEEAPLCRVYAYGPEDMLRLARTSAQKVCGAADARLARERMREHSDKAAEMARKLFVGDDTSAMDQELSQLGEEMAQCLRDKLAAAADEPPGAGDDAPEEAAAAKEPADIVDIARHYADQVCDAADATRARTIMAAYGREVQELARTRGISTEGGAVDKVAAANQRMSQCLADLSRD